mgnify:CR=1 FL=1
MSDTSVPPPPPAAPAGEDKTAAILSYITLIGFIIAIIMHNGKKTQLGTFHLQQALGLLVTGIVGCIVVMICSVILAFIPVLGWILSMVISLGFWIGMLALMIIGIINAVNGASKPLPVVGAMYQKWFGKAFV